MGHLSEGGFVKRWVICQKGVICQKVGHLSKGGFLQPCWWVPGEKSACHYVTFFLSFSHLLSLSFAFYCNYCLIFILLSLFLFVCFFAGYISLLASPSLFLFYHTSFSMVVHTDVAWRQPDDCKVMTCKGQVLHAHDAAATIFFVLSQFSERSRVRWLPWDAGPLGSSSSEGISIPGISAAATACAANCTHQNRKCWGSNQTLSQKQKETWGIFSRLDGQWGFTPLNNNM